MKIGTKLPGLSYWHPSDDSVLWKRWSTWPHLVLVQDQGSDGVSAVHSLLYKKDIQICMTPVWDPAHGAWRDTLGCLRDLGYFPWVLLLMIVINLPHGPDSTDTRFNQMRAATGHIMATQTHRSCVLFQAHIGDMLSDLEGSLPEVDWQSSEEAAWEWLRDNCTFARKGYRCNLNRFMSVIKDGLDLKRRWTAMLFQCEVVALEQDMVSNKKFVERVALRRSGRDAAATPTTSSVVQGMDEKLLRSVAQNALVIAMVFLADRANRRMLEVVTSISLPVLR